jgi:hypothetical protein
VHAVLEEAGRNIPAQMNENKCRSLIRFDRKDEDLQM